MNHDQLDRIYDEMRQRITSITDNMRTLVEFNEFIANAAGVDADEMWEKFQRGELAIQRGAWSNDEPQ